jgi:hypothetical protein
VRTGGLGVSEGTSRIYMEPWMAVLAGAIEALLVDGLFNHLPQH